MNGRNINTNNLNTIFLPYSFLINFYASSSSLWTSLTVTAIIVGSVLLAPAIILGYAANAAEREEQGLPHGH